VLGYLQHCAERYNLRKDIIFETTLTGARWNESSGRWIVQTNTARTFETRYLVTSLGLLSKQNFPDIVGIDSFQGEKYHTGAWPDHVCLKNKRVGVIGNGSTGVQVITAIAKDVKRLVSFQRNPQFSVPSAQGTVTKAYRDTINEHYEEIWHDAKEESLFAFGFKETSRPTFSVSPEEREQIFEAAWRKGGGFRFMFETFGDISIDEAANNEAANFIKKKITDTVQDPEKARKLLPKQLYARRPLCDSGYYEQFNRDNVDVVSLHDTPIDRITPRGIKTSDGVEYELDIIIFATGFDAVDGNYTRLAIEGRNGETLKEHWSYAGPASYLGLSVPGFPNLFMILGPNGPFCNIPPAIESHVEFISDIINVAEQRSMKQSTTTLPSAHHHRDSVFSNEMMTGEVGGETAYSPVIEATHESERGWTNLCDELSAGSLFRKTDSWIFGANVPGKKPAVLFYFAGLSAYRKQLREIAADDWKGFTIV
jgi:cyclohexanone monooxygenase